MANKSLFASLTSRLPRANAVNEAGGRAYKLEPKHALAQVAATGTFGNAFYSTAEIQLAEVLKLIDEVDDNQYLARLALYAREKAFMKDMPAALLVALSVRDTELMHRVFDRVVVSAHDVGRCRDLTPERIKFRLRRLCATGYDLGAMVNRSRDRALYDATIRHFGSWREALTEAGINLANVTRHKPKNLDRDAMLLWIRNRKEAGQSITFSEVCFENRDYALAIKREFRSWARALEAAFLETDAPG
ncbi:MAG: hypothetical protein ACK5GJ_10505 [Planctomycetota bacterium]|jgi:60 kDa SS-A/Ro ribonucleoprotein